MCRYVHDPEQSWLYIIGRVKPGTSRCGPLQDKVSARCSRGWRRAEDFHPTQTRPLLAKTHVVLTPGGAGIQAHAGAV